MALSFRAADNGFTHVCAHRGYCLHYPENTLLAFEMARQAGATTCEIDTVLSRDGEAVVIHDQTLDRTTDMFGFVADYDLKDLRKANAAAKHAGSHDEVRLSTLSEVIAWAVAADHGLEIEIKERERPRRMLEAAAAAIREQNAYGNVIVISFDHVDLKELKRIDPSIRTEVITHARHADILHVLKSCGAEAVSIELEMFHEDDARQLHDAGFYQRIHLPRPGKLAPYWAAGRDPRARVGAWLSAGLIDSLSGDDVPFLRSLVDAHPIRS